MALRLASSLRVSTVRGVRTFSSYDDIFEDLGFSGDMMNLDGVYGTKAGGSGPLLTSTNPATGEVLAKVRSGTMEDYEDCIAAMDAAKGDWSAAPAPQRGEVVRRIGEELRGKQDALGKLISLEMGKIHAEGVGEVQESVDICDFAVGLSRALNGTVIPSERPGHFMMERYNPLKGHVGIITAFNFPNAVAFWNTALSLIAGNTQVWKPHENLSLVSIASQRIIASVLEEHGFGGVATLCCTGADVSKALVADPRIELVSFTGSTKVGRDVARVVSERFGSKILELGGNNAMIIMDDADLDLALRGTLFSAVGTAGQRCTTLRRLVVHNSVFDTFMERLVSAYGTVKIGDPLDPTTLCGPLHTPASVEAYKAGIETAIAQGGKVLVGGNVLDRPGNFVEPTIIEIGPDAPCLNDEVFAPIMYAIRFDTLDEAIAINNSVPQGLSSSLFTTSQEAVFRWTGDAGSDCGIVNVNIGPSGAEIGGAFGGEKETGGGRESGSDAWKQYMRRSTCTVNYSKDLPLAQGIDFGS